MRVFVAGASGVIGRRLTPMLLEAGHEVTGMTRSEERAAELRERGATAEVCDVFDYRALESAVRRSEPEVVVHQLTDLPAELDPRKLKDAYAANDRVRREGTRNLVRAATATRARRVIAQSIAFAYAPSGPPVVGEDHPLYDDAPEPWRGAVSAVRELERLVVEGTGDDGTGEEGGPDGVVLRYGFFYGPGTAYATDGSLAGQVRRRRFPRVGSGAGVFSFVHVDDAARAAVAALADAPPGVYNVVDDEPAPMRDWLPEYARALGAKPPFRVPKLLGRVAGGAYVSMLATELRGASNERAKRELGWEPAHASWRVGFREALG